MLVSCFLLHLWEETCGVKVLKCWRTCPASLTWTRWALAAEEPCPTQLCLTDVHMTKEKIKPKFKYQGKSPNLPFPALGSHSLRIVVSWGCWPCATMPKLSHPTCWSPLSVQGGFCCLCIYLLCHWIGPHWDQWGTCWDRWGTWRAQPLNKRSLQTHGSELKWLESSIFTNKLHSGRASTVKYCYCSIVSKVGFEWGWPAWSQTDPSHGLEMSRIRTCSRGQLGGSHPVMEAKRI